MTTNPGLSWASPFSSVAVLDLISGGAFGRPQCTDDGTTLYGENGDAGSVPRATSWPGPPGTTDTALDDPDAATGWIVTASTTNGSVQVGGSNDGRSAYWTTGGTVAAILTPFAGFSACQASSFQQRTISNDGTKIIGASIGVPNGGSQATQWTSGTPALLANPTFGGGNSVDTTAAFGCDDDCSIVVGKALGTTGALFSGTISLALYWSSGTGFVLSGYQSDSLQELRATADRCLADGSVIYGSCNQIAGPGSATPCYWDSLGTIDPTSGAAGVIHFLDFLAGGNTGSVLYCAETLSGFNPIAVGTGNDGSGDVWAVKWTGTGAVNLGGLPGGHTSQANACSEDGSVVVGTADDGDFITWPVYWNAANVIHKLPTVADPRHLRGCYALVGRHSLGVATEPASLLGNAVSLQARQDRQPNIHATGEAKRHVHGDQDEGVSTVFDDGFHREFSDGRAVICPMTSLWSRSRIGRMAAPGFTRRSRQTMTGSP